jgi:hypothetical protein
MKALAFFTIPLILLFAIYAFADYGTDTSGTYAWANSNETFGPAYNWLDASAGTNLGTGDDSYFTVSTPFAISFYGTNHAAGSNFYVGTNGMMGFDSNNMSTLSPQQLPNTATPNNLVALYWEDLIGFSGDHLYSYVTGSSPNRTWILSYDPWHIYYVTGNQVQFQVQILENDGSFDNLILLEYKDTTSGQDDHGAAASAGIENSNGTQGHSYCYYNSNLVENLAVAYVGIGGLAANPFSLLTPADGSTILVPPKKGTGGVTTGAANGKGSVDVTFTWENNGVVCGAPAYDLVQYELLIDDNADFSSPEYDITGIVGVEYPSQMVTLTVTEDTTYYWQVIASNPYWDQVDSVQCDVDFGFNLDNPPYNNIQPTSLGKVKAMFE